MMYEVQGERGTLAHIRCLLTLAWDRGQEETVGVAETLEAGGGCGLELGGGGEVLLGGRGLVFGRAPLYLSM